MIAYDIHAISIFLISPWGVQDCLMLVFIICHIKYLSLAQMVFAHRSAQLPHVTSIYRRRSCSFAQTSYHSHIDTTRWHVMWITYFSLCDRADSRFAPSQWALVLLCNDPRMESVLCYVWCTSNLFQVYTLHSIFVGTDTPVPIGDYFTWDSNLPPCYILVSHCRETVNSSPPGQNGHHFADDIFRCIFVNEKICIWTEISLKFVPKGPLDNKPALV